MPLTQGGADGSPDGAALPFAVVIGLDCMTGLQTARILAARGVPVVGLAADPRHPCARTRVCRRILAAELAGEGLVRVLETLGPDLVTAADSRAVLVPCTDASVLTLSRARDRLAPWFHVVLPAPAVVETLMDKVSFTAYAESAGLPVPRTFLLHDRAEAEAAARELSYPCILKPPLKTPRWQAHTKAKVYKAADRAELLAIYDRCRAWSDTLMVQAWVEGGDADLYSYNGYFDAASEPLAGFVARKIRQWPPETGTSCLGEECRNDVVRQAAEQLFRGIGYRGLGYVEMKRDRRTGEHFIIEPNIGRPTGRSAIAEAGGVALLYTMYADVVGLPLPEEREQRYGRVKWLHLRRDAQSAFHYWRRGELGARDWWRSWQGPKAHALYDPRDPVPFWADLWHAAGALAGSGGGRGA